MCKAIFLDRDGVVNVERGYVSQISEFTFIAGIFDVCLDLQNQGYMIFIITNQSGIARGYYSEREFLKLTDWMVSEFSNAGIKITEVYYCPHHPSISGICECRKPKPGMILTAKKKYNLNLSRSILVGDNISDIQAGRNAGIRNNILFRGSEMTVGFVNDLAKKE
jgi:D-glycero-D-manno-heptose 1,7-bisphosphate phosphatase